MDHPLINYDVSAESWRFKQEQLAHVFVAERLFDLAIAASEAVDERGMVLLTQLGNLAKGISVPLRSEIASTLIEHICEINDRSIATRKTKMVIAAVLDAVSKSIDESNDMPASYLATAIGMSAANQLLTANESKADRTRFFLDLFPFASPADLCFSGTISHFDFSAVVFSRCTFNHATWVGCRFNSLTVFDCCTFSGGVVVSCDGFGLSTWKDTCVYDRESHSLIESEQARVGRRHYGARNLRVDIETCLRKFITPGASSLKRVEEKHLLTGKISQSSYKDEIMAELKRHLIEQESDTARGKKRFRIRRTAESAVIHFAQNGVFSGSLQKVYDELASSLGLGA
jgi:hypothetical protein